MSIERKEGLDVTMGMRNLNSDAHGLAFVARAIHLLQPGVAEFERGID
jgi:hypothetical protein